GSGLTWLVRRSLDDGATWSTVDAPQLGNAFAWAISSDSQGGIYVAGRETVTVKSGKSVMSYTEWIVRKSGDGGNTWGTVDQFKLSAPNSSVTWGIGRDSTGNVAAVGYGIDGQGIEHWLVRTPDSSGAWQTI